jgi:type III secretion protein Q
MSVQALALPTMSGDDAVARQLLGTGVSLPFQVAGEAGLVQLTLGSGVGGSAPYGLACAHGVLALDEPGPLLSLFGECPVVMPAEPGSDDAWFWALFQQTLSEPLRQAFGFLRPLAAPVAEGIACRIDVQLGAAHVTNQLHIGGATLLGLLRAAPWQRRLAPWREDVLLDVPLPLGHLVLAAGHLAALRPGDVLVPESALFDSSGQGLIRLGRHCLQVRVDDRAAPLRLTLLALEETDMSTTADTDILTPEWDDTTGYEPDAEAPMAADYPLPGDAHAQDADTPGYQPAAVGGRFDDLPVALTIRCGRLSLALGELRNLAPGSVLQVQGVAPGTAALFHGERALAHGELVDVDGRLGLQITRVDVAG